MRREFLKKEQNGEEGTGFPGHIKFGEIKIQRSACVQIPILIKYTVKYEYITCFSQAPVVLPIKATMANH